VDRHYWSYLFCVLICALCHRQQWSTTLTETIVVLTACGRGVRLKADWSCHTHDVDQRLDRPTVLEGEQLTHLTRQYVTRWPTQHAGFHYNFNNAFVAIDLSRDFELVFCLRICNAYSILVRRDYVKMPQHIARLSTTKGYVVDVWLLTQNWFVSCTWHCIPGPCQFRAFSKVLFLSNRQIEYVLAFYSLPKKGPLSFTSLFFTKLPQNSQLTACAVPQVSWWRH